MWLFSARKPRPSASVRRVSAPRRLRLEALEDRVTPSTGGVLDPTFGSGGVVQTTFTNFQDSANAVTVQPDGKIVIAGLTNNDDFLVARYNTDGSLDTSFGSGGYTATGFAGATNASRGIAVALEPQANGTDKILVAGNTGSTSANLWGLAQYNANGTLDTTFGTQGEVTTSVGSNPAGVDAMAVDSLGRIIVAGSNGTGAAVLVRYTTNGALDTSFGSGGKLVTGISLGGLSDSVAIQANDQIVLAGTGINPATSLQEFVVARFNADGTSDSAFGSGGVVITQVGPGESFGGVALQGDGKIVVSGSVGETSGLVSLDILRYNTDGTLDTGFGTGGVVSVASPEPPAMIGARHTGVVVQADGKIIAAGQYIDENTKYWVLAALRVNPDGTVDSGYGSGGWASVEVKADTLAAIALQPDGKLLMAGSSNPGTSGVIGEVLLVRFQGNTTEPSFTITGPSTFTAGTSGTFTLTTLNPDGSADTGYSGTVQITSSDPHAILPGDVTITGGTGTFSVTLETAGTQSVAATDVTNADINGYDTGILVSPAAASQLVFTEQPTGTTAGQTLGTVQATLEDVYGNVETGDNSDQVTVSVKTGASTQLGGTLTETVAAGNAIFSNLLLDTTGSYTLAAVANLTGGGTLGPIVSSSFAITSPVSLSFGSITYNSKTKLYSETVTITNTTSSTLTGPISLELTNVPSGVVLTDATGTTNGNPYVHLLASGKTLKKGASTSITLTFTAASLSDITFGTEVVVGL